MYGSKNLTLFSLFNEKALIGSFSADELKDKNSIYAREHSLDMAVKLVAVVLALLGFFIAYMASFAGVFFYGVAALFFGGTYFCYTRIPLIKSAAKKHADNCDIDY